MFWRVASGSVSSSVEAILSGDNFTLEQLLAEDELVKEIKLPNEELLKYLLLDTTLDELMHHVVDAPNEKLEGEAKFNIPSAACEVLCCEGNQQLLEALTERLENTGIAESIVRLVGADEQTASSLSADQLSWVSETEILPILFRKMEGHDGAVIAENAAEVLAAIARAKAPPVTYILGSPENVQRLIDLCSQPDTKTQLLVQALTICIALVERRALWESAHQAGSAGPLSEKDRELESQAVQVLAPQAARLLQQLSTEHSNQPQATPYGLAPPLGSARLTVVALIAVLLRTGLQIAEEAIMQAMLLSLCLQLVITYPFNSLLHHKVTQIICCVLERGSDTLLGHLFDDCHFLDWLTQAQMEVKATPFPEDKRERSPLRAGYTGHITQIATKLAEMAESRGMVAEQIEKHLAWQKFAAERLQSIHQMEDVNAWQCGRPVMSEKPPGSSDADEGMGLEGDTLNGSLSAFEQNSFGIQSAFHISDSDSDEDNPNRADTLFEDAIEYDDNYNDFSNGMNGLCTHWKEDSRSPKAFNHRQRLSESLHERLENGEEGPPSPPSPPSEGTAGSRAFPSTWGELLNGHSTPVDHNPVNASEERGHVPDSWESLAPESSFASLSRQFQELQKDKDMLFFSTKRQAAPSQSSQGTAAGSAERPLSYWEEQSGNSHNPGTAGVGQGSGVGHSPLTQAVQSAHTGDSSEGRGGLEEDDSGPALDHAEFRQPSSSREGYTVSEDHPGIVQRYISECAVGTGGSDLDSHPAKRVTGEELAQELQDCLAQEEMEERQERLQEKEEETLVGNFTKLDVSHEEPKGGMPAFDRNHAQGNNLHIEEQQANRNNGHPSLK